MRTIANVLVSVLSLVSAVQAQASCAPLTLCPQELPYDLTCLTLVHSACDEFRDGILTESKIGILSKLQYLILNNCGITVLMKSPFQGNQHLKVLQLLSNQFQAFSPETFQGLTELQDLVVKRSNITSLPVGGFQPIPDLRSLDLQANQISKLEENSFGNLSKLESLDVSYNSIDAINGKSFKFLTSMTILKLQNNKISFLPDELFATLTHLRSLNLKSNQLVNFPDGAFQNITLESLNLASNQLTSIPKVRTNILNLENNQITSIKAVDFSEGIEVHHVNLRHNPITHIESGAFTNSDITLLNLESTELTSIPDNTISPSVSMMILNLGKNDGWECDCHQLWLVRYLQTTPNATQPICGSGNFFGKKLRKIAIDLEAACSSTSVVSTVSPSSKSGTNYISQQMTSIHGKTEISANWTPLSSTVKVPPNLKNTGEPSQFASTTVVKELDTREPSQFASTTAVNELNTGEPSQFASTTAVKELNTGEPSQFASTTAVKEMDTGKPSQFTSTSAVEELESSGNVTLIASITCGVLLMLAAIASVILWKRFKVSPSRTASVDHWPEEASSEKKSELLADSSIHRQAPGSVTMVTGYHGVKDGPYQKRYQAKKR